MDRKAKILWLWLPCVAGALAALCLRFLLVSDFSSLPLAARNIDRAQIAQLSKDSVNIANYLMIDSILSIVQSYYVDVERVSPKNILDTVVSSLKERTHMIVDVDKEKRLLHLTDGAKKQSFSLDDPTDYANLVDIITRIAQFIDGKPTGGNDNQKLTEVSPGAIEIVNYILESLDAHSSLLDREIYRELKQGTEGSFGGLGILVGTHESSLTIIRPIAGSPAEKANLKRHDKILDIDGVDTFGQSLDELVEYMRGEPGTEVKLSVLRPGQYAPQTVQLSRRVINVNSVESSLHAVDSNGFLLNLKIDNFSARTTREILTAVNGTISKIGKKLKGISIDLRSNPGGLLDQAVEVADLFLDDGVIVSTRGRRTEVENAGRNYAQLDLPVFVFIDKDSASASEIVAGALQDHDRAIVIGEPSFGKGSVQTVFELPAERALKLTIARYYTPSGRAIQNVGIYPDVWLQPVVQRHANVNLFGRSRYRNEEFLAHRLESRTQSPVNTPVLLTPFRAFHLVDEKTEDAFSDFKAVDVDIQAAKIILNKISQHYTMPIEEGMNHASHWIALASGELSEFLQTHNTKVKGWMDTTFGLDWSESPHLKPTPVLSFRISKTNLQAYKGSNMQIPWRLTNAGRQDSNQISVFLRSDVDQISTKEILVGKINTKEAKTGVFQVRIPENIGIENVNFTVGVTLGAMPLAKQSWHFSVPVADKDRPKLDFDYDLVNESKENDGALEPGENAKIKVYIRNTGKVSSQPIDLQFRSLSGRQMSLAAGSTKIDPIEPGDEAVRLIDVTAAPLVVNEILKLGMVVQSSNLTQPIEKALTIRSFRSKRLSDKTAPVAH